MATVLMTKDGEIIRVATEAVSEHERLGFIQVKNVYSDQLIILDPTKAFFGDGQTIESLSMRHYALSPEAPSATAALAATELDEAAMDVTSGITDPDYPRNLTVKGDTAGMAGDVIITGRNVDGMMISETIALDEDSEVAGELAFAKILSIRLPAYTTSAGETVSVGWGGLLGMPEILANTALLLVKLFDGAADDGSLALDADEIEKNIYTPENTPDGSTFDLYYIA